MTLNQTPLKKIILDTLRRSGPISFQHYMALSLYHSQHGYYTQDRERTGVHGDYFTSPDLHPIFARLIGRQAAEMWEILDRPTRFCWIEMGAGRGWFARDFLLGVKAARPDFHDALDYVAIEPGGEVRARLLNRFADESSRVRVLANLDELQPVTGCFFSNELVDAFPVSVVARANGRLREVYVTAKGETLLERLGPISESAVAAAAARYANALEEGQRMEVNLAAVHWIHSLGQKLVRGFALTIDYGDLAERLYSPHRPRGTLLAYRGHVPSEDFFSAPGEQDLTAHVNFSALIEAGTEVGLSFTGFTTQERFLMALGEENEFGDLYDRDETEAQRLQARLKLKRLVFPGGLEGPAGMGNIFKVLVQHRGVEAPKLTGLKYADK